MSNITNKKKSIEELLKSHNLSNSTRRSVTHKLSSGLYRNTNLNGVHKKLFREITAKQETRRNRNTNYKGEIITLLQNKYVTFAQRLWFKTQLRFYKNNNNLKTYIKQLKKSICENEQKALKDEEVERREDSRTVKYGEEYGKNINRNNIGYQESQFEFCPVRNANA